jgi:uncharacterized protein YaiL (DUF2058 family)
LTGRAELDIFNSDIKSLKRQIMKPGFATSVSGAASFRENQSQIQATYNLNRAKSNAVSADSTQRPQAEQAVHDATRATSAAHLSRQQQNVEQAKDAFAKIDDSISDGMRDTSKVMGSIMMSQGNGDSPKIDLGRFLDVYG